jgi:hypothetical protein
MTHRINGRLMLAVAAFALATTGLTTTAYAEDAGLSDVAVISGCANTTPPVQVVGGGGTFSSGLCTGLFTGVPDVCAVVISDPEGTTPEVAESCTVSFNTGNTYTNIACGTGTAHGQANLSSTHESEVVTFDIVFVAGQGVFTGTSPSDPGFVDQWAGVVDILPTNGACPVTQFRYTAALVAVDVPPL